MTSFLIRDLFHFAERITSLVRRDHCLRLPLRWITSLMIHYLHLFSCGREDYVTGVRDPLPPGGTPTKIFAATTLVVFFSDFMPFPLANKFARNARNPKSLRLASKIFVGGDGFEPPKSKTADLQSAPFGHSGIRPKGSRSSNDDRHCIQRGEPLLPNAVQRCAKFPDFPTPCPKINRTNGVPHPQPLRRANENRPNRPRFSTSHATPSPPPEPPRRKSSSDDECRREYFRSVPLSMR